VDGYNNDVVKKKQEELLCQDDHRLQKKKGIPQNGFFSSFLLEDSLNNMYRQLINHDSIHHDVVTTLSDIIE